MLMMSVDERDGVDLGRVSSRRLRKSCTSWERATSSPVIDPVHSQAEGVEHVLGMTLARQSASLRGALGVPEGLLAALPDRHSEQGGRDQDGGDEHPQRTWIVPWSLRIRQVHEWPRTWVLKLRRHRGGNWRREPCEGCVRRPDLPRTRRRRSCARGFVDQHPDRATLQAMQRPARIALHTKRSWTRNC